MAFLIDTSVLVRLANIGDPIHLIADRAVVDLHLRGEVLHVAPQNLVEFRNVATRPIGVNGLGLSAASAEAKAAAFESLFPLLAETPDIFSAWKALVAAAAVIGKRVHDARLIAVCQVYKVSHVLTFNTRHFVPLAGFTPGILVLHPANV